MDAVYLIGAIIIGVVILSRLASKSLISPDEAKRYLGKGAKLVDVRTPREFAAGHLDGAVNIPLQELQNRITELGDKSAHIVLYCRSGSRSGAAKRLLKRHGFEQPHNAGGMNRLA